MKILKLSKLMIDLNVIAAVEDLVMGDGRLTTVIHQNTGAGAFQLYSDNPKYEEDKAKLMTALVDNRE